MRIGPWHCEANILNHTVVKLLMVSLMHPGNLSQQETNFKSSHSPQPSHSHESQSELNSYHLLGCPLVEHARHLYILCLLSGALWSQVCVNLVGLWSQWLPFVILFLFFNTLLWHISFKCFAFSGNISKMAVVQENCGSLLQFHQAHFNKSASNTMSETTYVDLCTRVSSMHWLYDRPWQVLRQHIPTLAADPRAVVWEAVGLTYRRTRKRISKQFLGYPDSGGDVNKTFATSAEQTWNWEFMINLCVWYSCFHGVWQRAYLMHLIRPQDSQAGTVINEL